MVQPLTSHGNLSGWLIVDIFSCSVDLVVWWMQLLVVGMCCQGW